MYPDEDPTFVQDDKSVRDSQEVRRPLVSFQHSRGFCAF